MGNDRDISKMQAKAKASLERLDDLEKLISGKEGLEDQVNGIGESMKQVVMAVNGALGQLDQKIEEYKEMLNAVIGILGPTQVQTEIETNKRVALENQVAETKAGIAKALEAGELIRVDVASEKSLLAGQETKADGSLVPPGWAFVPMTKIKADFIAKLVGQPVGFEIPTDDGGTFKLLELYELVEKKEELSVVPPVVETVATES